MDDMVRSILCSRLMRHMRRVAKDKERRGNET